MCIAQWEPLSESGHISAFDCECLYAEAHRVIQERFGDVSDPYVQDGQRLRNVLGLRTDEHAVFDFCWNEEIADQIRRERQRGV
ncbi:MAG TPA: hypothetical protein VFL57_18540 [Bryobacteraceae bacterium]|nr:hypothetical protein [Bryobacteraceae bacterium]